jgi:Fe-S-cluster containining protein
MDIEDIYNLLPDVGCPGGCVECCRNFGVPSRTKVEDERIREYLRTHGMELKQAMGITCPYVSEKGCTIYPVRPLTCRLYGTSPNYLCKMGVRPLRLLHPDEEEEIFYLYRKNFF